MKFERSKLAALICVAVLMLPQIAGAACNVNLAADNPDARYTVGGEVVTDVATGLMWKLCSEGQSGSTCAGTADSLSWQDALKRVQTANAGGYSDWRLPNRAELASLVERKCTNPAINETVFPGTPGQSYWSSSTYARNAQSAWFVDFNAGDVFALSKTGVKHVRLVRAGKQ
jgi:hypothetical protein